MGVIGEKAARSALQSGDRALVTMPCADRPNEKIKYSLAGAGHTIGRRSIAKLMPDLVPMPDGLFGAEISQTLVLRR